MVPEGRPAVSTADVLENLMLGAFRKDARRNIDDNLRWPSRHFRL
jgi:hypothetical protein